MLLLLFFLVCGVGGVGGGGNFFVCSKKASNILACVQKVAQTEDTGLSVFKPIYEGVVFFRHCIR